MATRAIQLDSLISGITNASTGLPVNGGTIYFYEAGTTTPKYVYTEKEKTNGYYSYSLDAVGAAHLYADGEYKLVVKDSDGATVKTYDDIRLEYSTFAVDTITSTPYTHSTDNDLLLVNTTSSAITINALAAANWERPLKIKRILGANSITIDPDGSETIDGAATLTWNSDAVIEIISDGSNLRTVGFRSSFSDENDDTKILVYESDTVQIYASNVHVVNIDQTGLYLSGGFYIDDTQLTATVTEINSAVDGLTATAAELNSRCDGMPTVTTSIASSLTISSTLAEKDTIDLGTLTAGDYFIVTTRLHGTKGGTEGRNQLVIDQASGTGDVYWFAGVAPPTTDTYATASIATYLTLCAVGHIVTSGTMVLSIQAESLGSDTTTATVQSAVVFLKKQ